MIFITESSTALETALGLLQWGRAVVPLFGPGEPDGSNGKRPRGGNDWGKVVWTPEKLDTHYRRYPDDNLGIKEGPEFDLMTIDPDGPGPDQDATITRLFEGPPPPTMGWTTERSPCWGRLAYRSDPRLIEMAKGVIEIELPGVKLRVGGDGKQCQSACPPSRSSKGFVRRWNGVFLVERLPEPFFDRLADFLEEARPKQKPRPEPRPRSNGEASHSSSRPPDLMSRVEAYLSTCEPAISGSHGHNKTIGVACRVGPGFDLSQEEAFRAIKTWYSPKCDPKWSDKEIWHKVEDAYERESDRGWLLERATNPQGRKSKAATPEAAVPATDYASLSDAELGIVPLSTVVMEPIKWLWRYRLEVGGLSLMAGDAGVGKSQLLYKAAAIVSTGQLWPGGEGQAPRGNVVIVSAEDRPERTIRPRLEAMKADISRITILKAKVVRTVIGKDGKPRNEIDFMSFQDREYWKVVFDRIKDVRLFIADPLPSYLGKNVNDTKNREIRAVLEPFLDEVIWPFDIAMWGNTHLNKSVDMKTPLHRITDSIAYGALPRNVHFVVRDPDNEQRRFFKQAKCNDAPDGLPALPFKIEQQTITLDDGTTIETAMPVFEEEGVLIDLPAVMGGKTKEGGLARRARCAEKLLEILKDGPVESEEVKRQLKALGFGKDMIWEVKGNLAIAAEKDGLGKWFWSVPPKLVPMSVYPNHPDASDASAG